MISVVIPAYNEADAIVETVQKLRSILDTASLSDAEIVVVNDCSADNTGQLAADAGAKVVSHLNNLGYGKSLKDGIEAARYDTIVITDADGTYPLEMIPELVTEYRKGYDMIVGRREGAHYDESWLKKPLRRALRFIVEFTAGKKILDANSGLRVFSKKSVMAHFPQLCNTFSFTTSLTLAYCLTSRSIKYVAIPYHARVGKSKVKLLNDSFRTMQYIIQAILYYNPLKLFILFCALTSIFSVFAFVVAIAFQIVSAFLLAVGGVLVTIIIFSLGLIADQLSQLMKAPIIRGDSEA